MADSPTATPPLHRHSWLLHVFRSLASRPHSHQHRAMGTRRIRELEL